MSILSQIIAYAPNKIDTETKARAMVQGPRNMYNQGQLVQPSDGSRLQYDGSKESQVINAYKILKNKLNRNPTRIEMVDAGFDATTVDKWTQKNNLKLIKAQYTQEFQDKRIKGLQKSLKTKKYDKLVVHDGKIKGPNSLVKAYLKDLKKRFKYPHDSKKYKQALEAGKVLSNSQLMEKYNLSLNSVERLNSVLTKSNKLKYPKQTYEGSLKIIKDQTDKRETAIKEKDGSVKFKKGTKEFPKGHAGNIYGNNLIKPGEIIYTPQKINVAMAGGVDPKNPKNRYSALDYKIKATEEDIDRIKKSKMSPNQKRIELQKLDNKLVEYVGKSDGYKIATLSDGSKYGDVFRKAQSMDPMDIFPDKTEKEVIEFLKKYKNKKVKVNAAGEIITPQSEIDNIQKAVMFDENSKLALNNAKKVKVEKDMLEFAGTITDKCKIDFSKGGRIGFKTGSADCLRIAREGLEKGLKTGFPKNQQVLAEGILKAGRSLKDIASIRGLLGPAALAFTAAAEAGIVGYDMLSTGKSFREAVGDSVFNYMLGDRIKIDSEEEFIKRLKNIKTGPSGLRDFSDEEIGKMQYFKQNLKDLQTGFDLYNKLGTIDKNRKAISMSPEDAFNEGAFQLDLDKQEDAVRADIQDYNRTGTPNRVTDYLLSDKAGEGADALAKAGLLVEQDQLQDAGTGKFYQSPRGDEKRLNRLNELKYDIEKMYNPTKINEFGQMFIDATPGEQSYFMGRTDFMEGGIASLNVKK